jgi:hypothetical protein
MTVASAPHLRRLGLLVTIAALATITLATLLPEPGRAPGSHFCLVCGSFGGVDAVLNVALFVPLGVGLALVGFQGRKALLAAFALSALVEIAQLFIPGRDATIGDVLTNTLGGAIGFAACRYPAFWLRPSPRLAAGLLACWCVVWLAIQAASNFAFVPSIPDDRYYGQLARFLGNRAVFRGRVLSASADEIVIPNTAFKDSRPIRAALRDGATIAATVLPAGPTPGIAAIVRVADSEQREILLLAQNGTSMVFGVRTGAAPLRIRPPLFVVPDVFPTGQTGGGVVGRDSVRVSGRYSAREVRLHAQTASAMHDANLTPGASLGWTLILPFQWLVAGTRAELVLSCLWIAVLTVPFGYWGAHTTRASWSGVGVGGLTLVGLAGLAFFFAGFVFVPEALGLLAASSTQWLFAAAGGASGVGLARRARREHLQPIGSGPDA